MDQKIITFCHTKKGQKHKCTKMTWSLVSTGQIWDNLSINKNIRTKDISNIYTEKKKKKEKKNLTVNL